MRTTFGHREHERGQTMVETALILPIFILVVMGIIVFGIGLFYQQQVTTAAREAARYAAIHSASSLEPVCGHLEQTAFSNACSDEPSAGWPTMTAHARGFATGLDASAMHITACWSGYRDSGKPAIYDQGPIKAGSPTIPNVWADCTMTDANIEPITDTANLPCPATTSAAANNDTASNLASSNTNAAAALATNRVVVYACYDWQPPMAGFLGIPATITLKAVVSEGLQHQQ